MKGCETVLRICTSFFTCSTCDAVGHGTSRARIARSHRARLPGALLSHTHGRVGPRPEAAPRRHRGSRHLLETDELRLLHDLDRDVHVQPVVALDRRHLRHTHATKRPDACAATGRRRAEISVPPGREESARCKERGGRAEQAPGARRRGWTVPGVGGEQMGPARPGRRRTDRLVRHREEVVRGSGLDARVIEELEEELRRRLPSSTSGMAAGQGRHGGARGCRRARTRRG